MILIARPSSIMAGVTLGVKSLSSGEYLDQMRDRVKQPLLGEQADRVKNLLIVDEQGNIKDSLDNNQVPRQNPDKSVRWVKLKDISLPPICSAAATPPLADAGPRVAIS